ncbi:MAG TPA: division plane positioning ATPase MipZ, partial [Sphingomonadaceae bacterium]|nr:division plane positioning ATPase MipZ [Sphingomonadaceae bacterium]
MTKAGPHRIVFANEKGGTGKSTAAVHVAIALAYRGARVAALDLDPRQRTLFRYLENRAETERRRNVTLPGASFDVFEGSSTDELDSIAAHLGEAHDFLIFDTPGRDDEFARHVATEADTLVTPLNDSFIDFDLLARTDPEGETIEGPSIYAEMVWSARQWRAEAGLKPIDWIVLRNRLGAQQMVNKQKMEKVLNRLAKRIGFRTAPGFNERVIFRELFPRGLTLLDLRDIGVKSLNISNIAAR